jgi:hypothetical protein
LRMRIAFVQFSQVERGRMGLRGLVEAVRASLARADVGAPSEKADAGYRRLAPAHSLLPARRCRVAAVRVDVSAETRAHLTFQLKRAALARVKCAVHRQESSAAAHALPAWHTTKSAVDSHGCLAPARWPIRKTSSRARYPAEIRSRASAVIASDRNLAA